MHTYYVAEGHFYFPGPVLRGAKVCFPREEGRSVSTNFLVSFCTEVFIFYSDVNSCGGVSFQVHLRDDSWWKIMAKRLSQFLDASFHPGFFFFFIWNIHTNRYYSRSLIVELVICKSGPVGCPQPFVYGSKLRIIQFWTTNDILRHCELEVFRDNDWHFSTVL